MGFVCQQVTLTGWAVWRMRPTSHERWRWRTAEGSSCCHRSARSPCTSLQQTGQSKVSHTTTAGGQVDRRADRLQKAHHAAVDLLDLPVQICNKQVWAKSATWPQPADRQMDCGRLVMLPLSCAISLYKSATKTGQQSQKHAHSWQTGGRALWLVVNDTKGLLRLVANMCSWRVLGWQESK